MALTRWIAEQDPQRVEWLPIRCERTGPTAGRPWTEAEVWVILQQCLCDVLGVRREDVTYEARMIEDLGMD